MSTWATETIFHSPVIQRPFEPLGSTRHEGILMKHHQMPAKTADAFAPHWIALISHGAGTDLC